MSTKFPVERRTYDCVTCGEMKAQWHDGRDDTICEERCISAGMCAQPEPVVKGPDGLCWWAGENGRTPRWYEPDPDHLATDMNPDDLEQRPYKPLPGQIDMFDGSVVGARQ